MFVSYQIYTPGPQGKMVVVLILMNRDRPLPLYHGKRAAVSSVNTLLNVPCQSC